MILFRGKNITWPLIICMNTFGKACNICYLFLVSCLSFIVFLDKFYFSCHRHGGIPGSSLVCTSRHCIPSYQCLHVDIQNIYWRGLWRQWTPANTMQGVEPNNTVSKQQPRYQYLDVCRRHTEQLNELNVDTFVPCNNIQLQCKTGGRKGHLQKVRSGNPRTYSFHFLSRIVICLFV